MYRGGVERGFTVEKKRAWQWSANSRKTTQRIQWSHKWVNVHLRTEGPEIMEKEKTEKEGIEEDGIKKE